MIGPVTWRQCRAATPRVVRVMDLFGGFVPALRPLKSTSLSVLHYSIFDNCKEPKDSPTFPSLALDCTNYP